jgi:hypothetical protein
MTIQVLEYRTPAGAHQHPAVVAATEGIFLWSPPLSHYGPDEPFGGAYP